MEEKVTRRGSLVTLGGAVVAAAAGWKAVGSADRASAGPAAVASGLVSCVLSPEQTAGPYYLPGDLHRRNVTEGKVGMPLTLKLTVVDVSTCKVVRGASVDIWHCDAGGVYSGVAAQATQGQTFLRGVQKTDAKGLATFKTIYPGWYPGRTVHIHVRVSLGGNIVHTGQLYFADATTDSVYRTAPYSARPGRDPRNAGDAIYRNGGKRSMLKLTKVGGAYTGTISMGVHR
jgi:protocatechuate 3,4-dioxygenase beta subunit